jgi:hypothetical protein
LDSSSISPVSSSSAAAAAGGQGAVGGDVLLLSAYICLPELWVLLKDQLVLPLLISCCRALGHPPPTGIIAMPWEMQEALLKKLKVRGKGVGGGAHCGQVGKGSVIMEGMLENNGSNADTAVCAIFATRERWWSTRGVVSLAPVLGTVQPMS